MNELGEYLRKLRGKMSLREAAKKTGISFSYIGYLESGKHPRTGVSIKPSPEMLKSIAKGYDHPYRDLMIMAGYDYEEEEEKKGFLTDPQKLKMYELIDELDDEDKQYILETIRRIKKN